MTNLLIRLLINGAALWVAATYVDGIALTNDVGGLLFVALIFGLINALIKPIVGFFTCPFYVITLGLFTFIVNALMLLLTSEVSGERFVVDGFVPALLGGIVISIISTLLSLFLVRNEE